MAFSYKNLWKVLEEKNMKFYASSLLLKICKYNIIEIKLDKIGSNI